VAFAGVVGALVPWPLSGHAIRNQIIEQVRRATGLKMDSPTRVAFALLPRPLIKIEGVDVHDSHGDFSLTSHVAKGALRLTALFTGHIELSSITLFHPDLSVKLQERPLARRGAIARASAAAAGSSQAARADAARLGVVRMIGGRIALRDPARGFGAVFSDVDAKLDWARMSGPATLSGAARWRGRRASVRAWLGKPSALLRGSVSAFTIRAQSGFTAARFDGSVRTGPNWQFKGRTSAFTSSVFDAAQWLDGMAVPAAFGSASVSAQAQADAKAIALKNLRLSLGGSRFEGSAALRTNRARPILSATVATSALAVTPFLSELPPAFGEDGSWSQSPLSRDLGGLDLDLRISATRAKLGGLALSNLGMEVLLEKNRLQFDLPEAKAYGGMVKARVSIAPAGGVQTLSGSATFSKVDAGRLLWAAAEYDRLSGTASGGFSVQSRGASVADLVRGLTGRADFTVSRGEFAGVDFERALRRINSRPLSVASEVHGGGTYFDTLSGGLTFGGGAAALNNVALAGPGVHVALAGEALIGRRALRLAVTARQAGPHGSPSADGSHMTVKVRGSWDEPRLVLNVDKLVRRSEAAAPLFETTAVGSGRASASPQ